MVVPQQVDLFIRWEVWRHTEVGARVTALSEVNAEDNLKSAPEEPGWFKWKGYTRSDNEAVRSRGQDLVSTLPLFATRLRLVTEKARTQNDGHCYNGWKVSKRTWCSNYLKRSKNSYDAGAA